MKEPGIPPEAVVGADMASRRIDLSPAERSIRRGISMRQKKA